MPYHKTYCNKIKQNDVFCKHLIPVTIAKCPPLPWEIVIFVGIDSSRNPEAPDNTELPPEFTPYWIRDGSDRLAIISGVLWFSKCVPLISSPLGERTKVRGMFSR